MANSDVIITQAAPLGPPLLDKHRELAIYALGLYCLENGANVTTNATTVKARIASAANAFAGIPRGKLPPIVSAIYWAAVNTAASSDLANSTIESKLRSVAFAYISALDDDALERFIAYELGLIAGSLT